MELSEKDKDMFRQIYRDMLKGLGQYIAPVKGAARTIANAAHIASIAYGIRVIPVSSLDSERTISMSTIESARLQYDKAWPNRGRIPNPAHAVAPSTQSPAPANGVPSCTTHAH